MRCAKTVTPLKIFANRKNAKRSTGPRTERGKAIARFNAVTLGLFAKHVVIPICDGYKPERDFQLLLDGLHQDFKPAGFYEEWLVVKIAGCMWRLRRATRCESGSVRQVALRKPDRYDNNQIIEGFGRELCLLEEAEAQLRDSGTFSRKIYEQVAPFLEEAEHNRIRSEKENEPVDTEIDRNLVLTCIMNRRKSLSSWYNGLTANEGERYEARSDQESLPPDDDMDKVIRYEERMHRQIDWAVLRLLESQERRKTLRASPDLALLANGDSVKRSQ
jgi:hypothetical protein